VKKRLIEMLFGGQTHVELSVKWEWSFFEGLWVLWKRGYVVAMHQTALDTCVFTKCHELLIFVLLSFRLCRPRNIFITETSIAVIVIATTAAGVRLQSELGVAVL